MQSIQTYGRILQIPYFNTQPPIHQHLTIVKFIVMSVGTSKQFVILPTVARVLVHNVPCSSALSWMQLEYGRVPRTSVDHGQGQVIALTDDRIDYNWKYNGLSIYRYTALQRPRNTFWPKGELWDVLNVFKVWMMWRN